MYGDGSSPYIGLGRDLHRIAPSVHEFVQRSTTAMWGAKHDTWNPRGVLHEAMEADGKAFEKRTVDMFRSGVYHAVCFTHVARELLHVRPTHAFGLSLGEAAAYFAFDETNSKQSDAVLARRPSSHPPLHRLASLAPLATLATLATLRILVHPLTPSQTPLHTPHPPAHPYTPSPPHRQASLDASPVWTEALAYTDGNGAGFSALRKAWGVPEDAPVASFWAGFAVQASRAQVEAALAQLGAAADCVRLLIVNDTHTCIVAGKPAQCKALVAHLGCEAMPIEQGMAGHCKEAIPFRDEIARGAHIYTRTDDMHAHTCTGT